MKNYIDLHMHSKYSDDGEYTPTQLVNMCHQKGITIMSIADHNKADANEEGLRQAQKLGIRYLPAIEIDCTYQDVNFHLLGYGIDYQNHVWKEIDDNITNQELDLSQKKIELTNALGFHVTKKDMDSLSDNGIYTGEMFGEFLLSNAEYNNHPLLEPYRQGGCRCDNPYVNFYWDFYSQGKPCDTQITFPKLSQMIDLIHEHNAIAVLAHPGANLKNQFELFDQMADELSLDGVEAFSNYHDEKTVQYFYEKGKAHNLLTTCGSDFHGKTKPAISLGESHCPYDQEFIEQALTEIFKLDQLQ